MSSSVHVNSKGKDILIPREGRTQELDDTILTVEAKYPIKITQSEKKSELNLHFNGSNSFLFVKSILIQSKKLRNKRLCTVFR